MQKFKGHIAAFLLAVFTLGVIPAPLVHDLFSNHTDAAENHCQYYHKDLGRHIEEQQNHCPIFKADTPLYDAVKVKPDANSIPVLFISYKQIETASYSFSGNTLLPARAPPIA